MNVNKKLMAYDENIGEDNVLIPYVLTTAVWTEDGRNLDDILKTSPAELERKLKEILADAPDELNTLKEIADALGENKDSIKEMLNSIALRVKRPNGGQEGQVLKLVDGEIVWAEDKDTVYTPGTIEAKNINTDENHRFVTDGQIKSWHAKLTYDEAENLSKGYAESLARTFGRANGVATLDSFGKVPKAQLPNEVFEKEHIDLSGYLTNVEANRTYAKKSDIKDVDLSNYAKKEVLKDYVKIDKLSSKEDITNKGVVNGYASLDNNGKIPESQMPEKIKELERKINNLKSISLKKVYSLPTSGEENIIYLVSNKQAENNIYDEFIFIESKWEKIGSTKIDISDIERRLEKVEGEVKKEKIKSMPLLDYQRLYTKEHDVLYLTY